MIKKKGIEEQGPKHDRVPNVVRRMSRLKTISGGEVKFTPLMKLIYAYIYTFQTNKRRGNDDPIHTNTNVLAWEMGVSERAVITALETLDQTGIVKKAKKNLAGNVQSSNYVAIEPSQVPARGVTPPHPKMNSKPKPPAARNSNDAATEWEGDSFIKGRLSENALGWAMSRGATNWREACVMVWRFINEKPPQDIPDTYKPLSMLGDENNHLNDRGNID